MPALALTQAPAKRRITTPAEHFRLLHPTGGAGAVAFAWDSHAELERKKRWHRLRLTCTKTSPEAVLDGLAGLRDCYLTVNSFYRWRQSKNLAGLRAVFVDIDPPKQPGADGVPGIVDLRATLSRLQEAGMPAPSWAFSSGRGLHLYWLLDGEPRAALPLWQRVQDALCAAAGGDKAARDAARVLRLAGTVNSRTNTQCEGAEITGTRWTLRQLATEVLGERECARLTLTGKLHRGLALTEVEAQEWAKRQAEGLELDRHRDRVRDLNAARTRAGRDRKGQGGRWRLIYRDLLAIANWHQARGGIPEGHRDVWLHLLTTALSWTSASPESLAGEAAAAATQYGCMSSKKAVEKMQTTIQRAHDARDGITRRFAGKDVDPRYGYRTATMLQMLADIIPAEIELRALIGAEQAKARKIERDRARHKDHRVDGTYVSRTPLLSEVLRLHDAGLSLRAILEATGVPRSTASRWIARRDTEAGARAYDLSTGQGGETKVFHERALSTSAGGTPSCASLFSAVPKRLKTSTSDVFTAAGRAGALGDGVDSGAPHCDSSLNELRELPLSDALEMLGAFVKPDREFVPLKSVSTKRLNVSTAGGDWEIVITSSLWYDTRARVGGKGAIDLAMHVLGIGCAEAVRALRSALQQQLRARCSR